MRHSRRRPLTATVLSLAVVLLAGACGGDDDATDEAGRATTTTAESVAAEGTATVLDEGNAPRRQLRLQLEEGDTQQVTFTMRMAMDIEVDGEAVPSTPVPPMTMKATAAVRDVGDDGSATLEMTIDDASFSSEGVDPQAAEQMNASLAQLRGLKTTARISSKGATSEGSVDTSTVTDPNVKQVLDQLSTQFSQLSVPFPEEAVGEGARWTVRQRATLGGIDVTTVSTYTARELDGDSYELDVAQEMTAEPGPAALPGLPEGTKATIQSYRMEGTGTMAGSLTNPAPTRASVTSEGDVSMRIDGADASQSGTLLQHLRIQVDIASP